MNSKVLSSFVCLYKYMYNWVVYSLYVCASGAVNAQGVVGSFYTSCIRNTYSFILHIIMYRNDAFVNKLLLPVRRLARTSWNYSPCKIKFSCLSLSLSLMAARLNDFVLFINWCFKTKNKIAVCTGIVQDRWNIFPCSVVDCFLSGICSSYIII